MVDPDGASCMKLKYWISPTQTVHARAVARLLQVWDWEEAKAPADAALVIFHHEHHETELSLERLGFWRYAFGGRHKEIVFLPVFGGSDNRPPAHPEWVFPIVPSAFDRVSLQNWAARARESVDAPPAIRRATPEACRNILGKFLHISRCGLRELVNRSFGPQEAARYVRLFDDDGNLAAFHYLLLLICGNYDPKPHDLTKRLEHACSAFSSWILHRKNGAAEDMERTPLFTIAGGLVERQLVEAC